MSDEQHRVAHFQGQPEGLALFFRPTALSFAYVAWLHITHSALPGKKIEPAVPIKLVLTGPSVYSNSRAGEFELAGDYYMNRRHVLKAFTLACVPAIASSACAATRGKTARDAEGPFYPVVEIPLDSSLITAPEFLGDELLFFGRVLSTNDMPLADIRIDIWQCDGNSVYNHPSAPSAQDKDAAFRGFGATVTNAEGKFQFRTIVPVAYPGRPPHIHAKLWRSGEPILTTQIYLSGQRGASDRKITPEPRAESGDTLNHEAAFDFVV